MQDIHQKSFLFCFTLVLYLWAFACTGNLPERKNRTSKSKFNQGTKTWEQLGHLSQTGMGTLLGTFMKQFSHQNLRKASTHKSTFLGMSIHGLIFHLCSDIAAFLYWLAFASLIQNILGIEKVFPRSWMILANLTYLLILVLALVADNLSANLSSVAL